MDLRQPSLVRGCIVVCQMQEQPECLQAQSWKSLFSFLPNTCLGKSLPLLPLSSSRVPFISLDPVDNGFSPKLSPCPKSRTSFYIPNTVANTSWADTLKKREAAFLPWSTSHGRKSRALTWGPKQKESFRFFRSARLRVCCQLVPRPASSLPFWYQGFHVMIFQLMLWVTGLNFSCNLIFFSFLNKMCQDAHWSKDPRNNIRSEVPFNNN